MTHDLSTSTAAEDLEHKDMDAALCQNSRRRLFSVDEFQYLNVPHIELIMVYDDFECIFKCLYTPHAFLLTWQPKENCGVSYYRLISTASPWSTNKTKVHIIISLG